MPFETLSQLKQRIGTSGTTDDALLLQLQLSAENLVQQLCNRDFVAGTYTENHPNHRGILLLRNCPVSSITALEWFSHTSDSVVLLQETDYFADLASGVLEVHHACTMDPVPDWATPTGHFRIQYVVTATVPNTILQVIGDMVEEEYRQIKTQQSNNFLNISQQKIADTFVIFSNPAPRFSLYVERLTPYRLGGI